MQLVDEGKLRAGRWIRHAHRPVPRLPGVRDGVPVGRGVRQAGGGWRARRSSSTTGGRWRLARGARFRLPAAASLPAAHRRGRAASANLSALGPGGARSRHRHLEDCWACRIASDCCRRSTRSFSSASLGKTFPAQGARRARVAFFAGCVAQVTFSELNRATIRVLQANGCEVVVPAGQVCCGALPAHAGVRDVARDLARANFTGVRRRRFRRDSSRTPPAAARRSRSTRIFSQRTIPRTRRPRDFPRKMRDVTEFLAELGLTAPMRQVPLRVTYQDSCHLAHGQKIREAPRKLIRAVPGVEFVEMPLADQCCGSAGVYNVTETEASLELLALKMESVRRRRKSQAIVTANPGCILQLRAGAAIHARGTKCCTWSSCSIAPSPSSRLTTFRRRGSGSRAGPFARNAPRRQEHRSGRPRGNVSDAASIVSVISPSRMMCAVRPACVWSE